MVFDKRIATLRLGAALGVSLFQWPFQRLSSPKWPHKRSRARHPQLLDPS